MSQKDIKLLWGRSGNRCAIRDCRKELTQDKKAVSSAYTLGEQAHIVGEKEGAARGNSPLTSEEREGYHNRILLCPTHHTDIDENEEDWPVERLYQLKSEHELWVSETLSVVKDDKALAAGITVSNIIDAAVTLCRFETWYDWTQRALSPTPIWSDQHIEDIECFEMKVRAAIWPEQFGELRRAALTLSCCLVRAKDVFLRHGRLQDSGEVWKALRFYKAYGHNPDYDRDLEKFNTWVQECYDLVYEATKAANWFADVVRKDLNPFFFIKAGKFVVTDRLFRDLTDMSSAPEYSQEERKGLPAILVLGEYGK
ncbi:hypothetical protein [Sneathiella chinensis]|nr:hypothetical protein [Sneathiella chinensis]